MLNEAVVLLTVDCPCDEAVDWLADRIRQAGFSVVRTFNLQDARRPHGAFPCPHHSTQERDCQMVVLQIYNRRIGPLTLIAHGYDGQTWFSMVDTPQQRADPWLKTSIRRLASVLIPEINQLPKTFIS